MARNKERNAEVEAVEEEVNIDSETVVDEKKAAAAAKQLARKEAKERVRAYANELEDENPLKADILLIIGTGSRASGGATRVSINGLMRSEFLEKGFISEMDIFMTYKIGRPEMRIKERLFVKNAQPEDRIYIRFNEEKEGYDLIGQGAELPEDWEGWRPAEQATL